MLVEKNILMPPGMRLPGWWAISAGSLTVPPIPAGDQLNELIDVNNYGGAAGGPTTR